MAEEFEDFGFEAVVIPSAVVEPGVVVDLIRTMQQGQRLAAGHALLAAQTLVGAAEKAEARPRGWRARLAARLLR